MTAPMNRPMNWGAALWFVGLIAGGLAIMEGYALLDNQVRALPFVVQMLVLLVLIALLAVFWALMLKWFMGRTLPKPIAAFLVFASMCMGTWVFLVDRTKWSKIPMGLMLAVVLIQGTRQLWKQDEG